MNKSLLYAFYITIACSQFASAYSLGPDEKYITDWELFSHTVESYKKGINNQKNIKYAKKAEARGKAAFLKGEYAKADYRGYGDAIAWIPRPEYYFIVGDLNMRSKLSLHTDSPYSTPQYKACWDKYLFALDVEKSVGSLFETGFSLTAELDLSATKNSKIYQQALTNAACFARLTSKYSEGVGPQCVPVEEVKSCLGSPLLLLYH
ncbi:hypothetical protein NJH83_11050 [Pseudomonas chlororaphis]|uniref:hypothetical protein n=1 Tax=Pseudomonas chlororaphis TaxID=587753 RepID=UPI00209ABED7|nr:hypothetical protein [Pseudomonas chlororaphis]MCO7610766.1 hypothetical protein [Pseudomonas chlororaphis]